MKSGWDSKNTIKFGFNENGNHIIFNMDGETLYYNKSASKAEGNEMM